MGSWSRTRVDFLQKIDVATVLIQFAVLLFSLSIHEASHAWVAGYFGDYTARYLGRVSLNPIAHIDPIGTILFPLLNLLMGIPLIGWAKPVPVNSVHLRNHAGALVNHMITNGSIPREQSVIAPLLGILFFALVINMALALFNFIPIPPLDGHWVLYGLLPYNAAQTLERISSYGIFLLYGLMLIGAFRFIFVPIEEILVLLLRL